MPFSSQRPIIDHMNRVDAGTSSTFDLKVYGFNFHPDCKFWIDKYNDLGAALPPVLNSFTIHDQESATLNITTNTAAYKTQIWATLGPDKDSRDWTNDAGVDYLTITATPSVVSSGHVSLSSPGKHHTHYPTINAALADALSGDVLTAEPGTYIENVVLPDGVVLQGVAARTVITSLSGVPLTLGNQCEVNDVVVVTPSAGGDPTILYAGNSTSVLNGVRLTGGTAAGSGIFMTGTGELTLNEITFVGCNAGVGISCATANSTIRANVVNFSRNNVNPTFISNNGFMEIKNLSLLVRAGSTVNLGVNLEAGSTTLISNGNIHGADTAIYVNGENVDLEMTATSLNGATYDFRTDLALVGTDSVIQTSGVSSSFDKWLYAPGYLNAIINGITVKNNIKYGERSTATLDEPHFGAPDSPVQMCGGEGDSYVRDMHVWTFNAADSAVVDITPEASSGQSSTFTFSGNVVGNRIYIGGARKLNAAGDLAIFEGIKSQLDSVGVGGTYTFGIVDGPGNDVPINIGVVAADHTTLVANVPFTQLLEHIRFNQAVVDSWAVSDPVGIGSSYRWAYIEITTIATTLPVFEKFKIYSNRFQFEKDGFGPTKYGRARSYGLLVWDLGLTERMDPPGTPTYALNQDIYRSNFVGVGRVGNRFPPGVDSYIGWNTIVPLDMDTSCPVKVLIKFTAPVGGGDVVGQLKSSFTYNGDGVYSGSGLAPVTAPNEKTFPPILTAAPIGAANVQQTFAFDVDLSDMAVRPDADLANVPVLWMTIARLGSLAIDTNLGNLNMIQISAIYVKLSDGGHI